MHGGESDVHVGEDLIQMRIDTMLGNGTQNKQTELLFYNSVLKKTNIFVKFHFTFLLY